MYGRKNSFLCFFIIAVMLMVSGCGSKGSVDSGRITSQVKESEKAAVVMEKTDTEEDSLEEQNKEAEAFAETVQEAFADRNVEVLGDLISYPCVFITVDQETIILDKREDLIKQNPDMIFGDDLMVAVANVDTASLKVTKEGVTLGEGTTGITFFDKSNGSFQIKEIRE